MRFFSLLVLLMILTLPVFGQEGDIVLNINGHNHVLPLEIKNEINKQYKAQKDSIISDWRSDPENEKINGDQVTKLHLGNEFTEMIFDRGRLSSGWGPFGIYYFVNHTSEENATIRLTIPGNYIRLRKKIKTLFTWTYVYKLKFDLQFHIQLAYDTDSLKTKLVVDEDYIIASNIRTNSWFADLAGWISGSFLPGLETRLFKRDYLDNIGFTIDLSDDKISGDAVSGVDKTEEINAIVKSVPLSFSFGKMIKSGQLLLNLDFMHGYTDDGGVFQHVDQIENIPQQPADEGVLEHAGFGYLHWGNFDSIEKQNTNLKWNQRVEILFERMEDMGWNQFRFEAVWSDIVDNIPSIDPSLDPDNISDPDIVAYEQEIESNGGWARLDSMRDMINANRSFLKRPVMVVGSGHIGRPPLYNDNGVLKRIAPGTVRQKLYMEEPSHKPFIGVDENIYLYWLIKYTRAVVRRYGNDFIYWQAETELNAARFTESFYDWWRAGSAWGDDTENGFQTEVAQRLYEAIHHEAGLLGTEAHVIQQFHLFNAAKRIVDWKDYYEIVGLNIYPHLKHAWPLLGFLPGEFVWSSRRILKSLGPGYENKEVWILETGYAGKVDEPSPDELAAKMMHYSYDNQAKYLRQAMYGCAANGAKAFQWFLPETPETENATNIEYEKIDQFNGFYDSLGTKKPAYQTAVETFDNLSSSTTVSFANKYQNDNLGGYFNIKGVISGIQSGRSINLNQTDTFDVSTTKQYLLKPASSDTLKLRNWNSDLEKYFLSKKTNFGGIEKPEQISQFYKTVPVQFSMNMGSHNVTDFLPTIGILDPWMGSVTGITPNEPVTYLITVDKPWYKMFKGAQYKPTSPDEPYYTVHTPEIFYTDAETVSLFRRWNNLQDVDITYNNSSQTPIEITGDVPHVEAEYWHDIRVENSSFTYENGVFNLKAPQAEASLDSLYEFVEWKVYDANGVTENNSKMNIISPTNYKSSATFNSNGSNTVIKPKYRAINNLEYFSATLANDEVLLIPEGANIHFAKTFSLNVYGAVEMIGKPGKEIILSKDIATNWDEISPLFTFYPRDGYDSQESTDRSEFKYVHFKNIKGDIQSPSAISLRGSGWSNKERILIDRCVFENCDRSINFESDFNGGTNLQITNCTFYKAPIVNNSGGAGEQLHASYSIFYDSECSGNGDLFYNIIYPGAFTSFDYSIKYYVYNPQFVDALNGDFHLQWGSPCIDTDNGTPETIDPDGTLRDIGAYFYAQLSDTLIGDDVTISGEARITGDFTLQAGKSLTINPGTVLKIAPDVNINIDGTMSANGTAADSIIFTSSIPNPSASDYWSGITFNAGANNSGNIKYCRIEDADNGVIIKNNSEVSNNLIRNISSKGIYTYESTALIKNNSIDNCGSMGIYVSRTDYVSGEQEILNNKISNCNSYGIRFYYSSPAVRDNEIHGAYYGIYCFKSSPYLGGFSGYGNNYIHDNTYGLRAYQSSPFLGEDYCGVNGGHNWISNNGNYDVYASSSSSILAENNWWGTSPPQTSKFYTSTSSIDYNPYLTSPPIFNSQASPEVSVFDYKFGVLAKITSDSLLTESQAMANFDSTWAISRKLKFARNLVNLNFPESAHRICKDIIRIEPDLMYSYAAFDIIWKTGKLNDTEFQKFRSYTDSLGKLQNQNELEEFAEFVDGEFDDQESYDNGGLSKASRIQRYKKYTNTTVAANALFNELEYNLIEMMDKEKALDIYTLMKSEFPDKPETMEAAILLGLINEYDPNKTVLVPLKYELSHNYPNPFNATTTFKFGIPEASNIKIEIFNTIGQKVKVFFLKNVAPGYHKQVWKGVNNFNNSVASGMYIYKFTANSTFNKKRKFIQTGKMLLLK